MRNNEFDLVARHLKSAEHAFRQGVCFGQVLDLRLPHKQLVNGYPARIRVAVGPDRVVCRVTNAGREDRLFHAAAQPLLEFANREMRGWSVSPNSSGTGGGRVFFNESVYWPPRHITPIYVLYADVSQAVSSARAACESRSRFSKSDKANWQSAYTDNGNYPVEWTVEAKGVEVITRIINKGRDSMAFSYFIDWLFKYIQAQHSDGQGRHSGRGYFWRITSDTLKLEVPCL